MINLRPSDCVGQLLAGPNGDEIGSVYKKPDTSGYFVNLLADVPANIKLDLNFTLEQPNGLYNVAELFFAGETPVRAECGTAEVSVGQSFMRIFGRQHTSNVLSFEPTSTITLFT